MDSYSLLLERTRSAQPSIQRYAVISIFEKFRSALSPSDSEFHAGRNAISQCLTSHSAAVLDQSVREICRLVREDKMKVSEGLLELQAVLEGCDPRAVDAFVKGIGFICCCAFKKKPLWSFESPDRHPFIRVLSCRSEVQEELSRQVLLFIMRNRSIGLPEVLGFLRPFVMFSILRIQFTDSSFMFASQLISSIASLSTCFHSEAMFVIKYLMECLRYFPFRNQKEFKYLINIAEYLVDSYVVVLKQGHATGMLIDEIQVCGAKLLEALLSLCTDLNKCSGGIETVIELSRHLLLAQKDLGLRFIPELLSVITSLIVILTKAEFEHEQLSIVKLSISLLKWKDEYDHMTGRASPFIIEDLLFVLPVLHLLSSPARSVKTAAADLLSLLEKSLSCLATKTISIANRMQFPSISTPGSVVCRLLHHLWFQEQFLSSISFHIYYTGIPDYNRIFGGQKSWVSQLRDYSLLSAKGQKSEASSQCQEIQGISLLLGAVVTVFVMHPTVHSSAVDSLIAISSKDPTVGMPLLLSIPFFHRMFSRNGTYSHAILLKLLEILPSLASQSVMVPLVVQSILPMLQKDAKSVLYATAVRLLCKTWEVTDRVFGFLQGVLQPTAFTEFSSQRDICISMAASIRDVCKANPDRGVDLILSVSACIESKDPIMQSLGLTSLAHLCEADVVDFYTAWAVIAKHVLDYSAQPIVAYGLCIVFRWGAMDAEAYPEASKSVLQILWQIGTTKVDSPLWIKARSSAIESLTNYEIKHIKNSISDFEVQNYEKLISEENLEVLEAWERFEAKVIAFKHISRRRMMKEKKVTVNKVEKLLDVFPRVMFSSGKGGTARNLPGAALLSLSFDSKDMRTRGTSKDSMCMKYENALIEIAESLDLSRNILVAFLSLQSWRPFMYRWMRVVAGPTNAFEGSFDAANYILKVLCRTAEESLPRSAENISLAIGALCTILPTSAHVVISAASKFLLMWLFQYEHEHRQWTSAISLGLVSCCLHATDSQQRFQVITGLLKVASDAKSMLVKGACGVGLGFSSQNFLPRITSVSASNLEEGKTALREVSIIGNIIRGLSHMLCQVCPSSIDSLQRLCRNFPSGPDDTCMEDLVYTPCDKGDNFEEDIWGVSGLVLGLGNCVVAMYRAGAHDAVLNLKDILLSWVPHVNSLVQGVACSGMEKPHIALSVGSCLVLPTVVTFCKRMELIDDKLDNVLMGYKELISELLDVKKSGTVHQSLLTASCIGAGNLVSSIFDVGTDSMKVDDVKSLLESMRSTYMQPYPPTIHLGGMLGVVNAMGADAGFLTHVYPQPSSLVTAHGKKETCYIRGPLLSNPILEQYCTSLMQEMFLVAQDSEDQQIQRYAAWAVAFLRSRWWSKEFQSVSVSHGEAVELKSTSQSFGEGNIVWQLSLWLMDLNSETGIVPHVNTVTTVLRCLSHAPRLPALDWGPIIRYLLKYGDKVSSKLNLDTTIQKGELREACICFSIAHAYQRGPLMFLLDELSDLARFQTLELKLQCSLLCHLGELEKVFSGSRLEKLFGDMFDYFSSSLSSYQAYAAVEKSQLRVSFWKGLCGCLPESSGESPPYIWHVEKCMELLFCLLPGINDHGEEKLDSEMEWWEAARCLGKAPRSWLMNILQVNMMDLVPGGTDFNEVSKRIKTRARLTTIGCIPVVDLAKLSCLLNIGLDGIWDVLLEVSVALQQAEDGTKRQWLIDAVEISCITKYPSTALQFIGLLSSGWCKYAPLLVIDQVSVLSDLPISLPSLLSDSKWMVVTENVVQKLWVSMERIYAWTMQSEKGGDVLQQAPINASEISMSLFLTQVMHATCFALRKYLPFEKQLKLADTMIP
ncbi:protein RST1 [Aristolochia californica]|uniref:protein RST1 n=1 Tax=Aristolochia californica TaxID=171875 RepID=UPI0035E09E8A